MRPRPPYNMRILNKQCEACPSKLLMKHWFSQTAGPSHQRKPLNVVKSCFMWHSTYIQFNLNLMQLFLRTSPTSPPMHFTRAPPSHAKNRYLNSRLMILHASELATELFDEVLSPRCMFAISIATAKLPAWSRHVMVTCMVLRNKNGT